MALMFEQLGAADAVLRLIMFGGPIALYAVIGFSSSAREARDYFACGRRVPAFFNGLVLGVTALGGAGFLALTGSLFIIGFDAVCLSIGWYAGLVFMGVLFAPFVRKFGAYTVPTFLGRRFESRMVRVVAAGVLSVPILLLLAAEARFAGYAAAWLLGQSERLMAAVVVACAAAIVFAGGMRSLTWSSVAKAIAALLALAVPASIVALMVSNLPLPQMTHGNVLRLLTRMEIAQGVPIVLAPPLAFDLPGDGRRAAGQALHPVLRQRRQPELRAHVVRGWRPASPPRPRCCRGRARRPASTRRASRWAGPCSSPASCS